MISLRDELRALPVLAAAPPELDVADVPDTPHALFVDWFRTAVDAGEVEPHAMTLSTHDDEGPDARVLILKDLDEHGWWFATSSASAKGEQLRERPAAALTFYWPSVGRQVRVRGDVLNGSREQAASDFRARSRQARAVALASRTSTPMADLSAYERAVQNSRADLEADPDLVSDSWTLYAVRPAQVEFWQADSGRRHLRLRYSRHESGWARSLLWP